MPPSTSMSAKSSGVQSSKAATSNPLSDLSKAAPRPSANPQSSRPSLPGNVFVAPPSQSAVKGSALPPTPAPSSSSPIPKGSNTTPVPPLSMKGPSLTAPPSLKGSSSAPVRPIPSVVGKASSNIGAGASNTIPNTANTFAIKASSTTSPTSTASAKPITGQELFQTKPPVLASAKESSSKKISKDNKSSGGDGSGCLL